MDESSNSIVESRQELTISLKNHVNPTFRTAHFLKPSFDSTLQPISTLSSIPLPSLPPIFDPPNWPLSVDFRGWKNPTPNWNEWVHNMVSSHASTWKKAGIFHAILSSTYRFNRHNELILGVAERWCPDTNSFCFPWGEATVTLEDMLMAGYSVLGSPVFEPLETEYRAIQEALIREKRGFNKTPAKKPYHNAWLNAFMDSGSEMEHEAFLSLWLSRFVLPTSNDVICDCVFPIAIRLARGTRIALAPAVLGSIYRDLSLLKQKVVSLTTLDADDKVDVITYAPFQLVLVWVWERFVKLSPKPNLVKNGEPRFALWNNVKCNVKDVRLLLDSSKDCFNWRPYTKIVENWDMPKFYGEQEMQVSLDSDVDEEILSFVMCLRVSKLVGLDSEYLEAYFPQRVARQFGFDQDLPGFVSQGSATRENAWDCYISPVTGIECYIPSRVCEGEITTRYLEWWDHSVSVQHQEKASEKTPKVSKVKEKGLQTSSSPPISSKSLKRKTSAGELNVSKVSATDSKRTKEGESSKIRIGKKAEGERSGLKISAKISERTKIGQASKSPISKKAAGKLNRFKVSAEGSDMTKKGEASNSNMRKKAAGKLKGLNVSGKSMKKCGTSKENSAGGFNDAKVSVKSSEKIKKGNTSNSPTRMKGAGKLEESRVSANSPKTTRQKVESLQQIRKRKISGEDSVFHANRAKKSKVSAESSRIKNKLSNKPAISLVVEINDFLVPPKNDTDKAGDPTADDSITIAEMIKGKKKHNGPASKKHCVVGKKLADKRHSAAAAAKTSDIALTGTREGQTEDIENEKDGDNKTTSSQSKSHSSSPADNESLKGPYEEKLKQSEACESKQTCSNGDVSVQSHLSGNEGSPNVLDPVASKERVKHSTASGSKDEIENQLGGFQSDAESEPLEVLEAAPLVETVMLEKEVEYVQNVDQGESISSATNKAVEVVKSATLLEKLEEPSKEAEKGEDMDTENATRQFDQSESHASSVAGNETPKVSEVPENGMLMETGSLTENDCSRGNVAHNGSNEYSIDSPKLMMLEARIEKLRKMMAVRKAAVFKKHMANKVTYS
ncbi:Aminotransferase-like plant mobile domain family protein [Euphorbia peplus]|nr:Aminotransferase-like plant mobile domain family protein [Euphorbia peplus]